MQLVLPVHQHSDYTLNNYIAGENEGVVAFLQAHIDEPEARAPNQSIVVLHGANGVGKTHVLLGAIAHAHKNNLTHQYIDMNSMLGMPTAILEGMADCAVLALDNIDEVAGKPEWERAIFDLINQCMERNNKSLLLSMSQAPKACGFALPDLLSRLEWGTRFSLKELSDEQKLEAIQAHLASRGMLVNSDVPAFLMRRSKRNMHAIMALISELDKTSLQKQRKLTIPFIKSALAL